MLTDVVNEARSIFQEVFTEVLFDEEVSKTLTYYSIDTSQSYNPETGEFVSATSGTPAYAGLTVNPSSLGNDVLSLDCGVSIESPGNDPLNGWTIEIGDGTSYATMDLSTAVVSINDDSIQVSLSGFTRGTIHGGHVFRVSYSGGDIRNPVTLDSLPDFSNDVTYTNNSTIDLISDIENWYKFEESAGATRLPEISDVNYNLSDNGTVGIRTGASGSGNAADFSGTNYLITSLSGVFDPTVGGVMTIAFYMYLDALPSVVGSDAYPVNKWRNTNNRSWTMIIPSTGPYTDTLIARGHNASDEVFSQIALNRGVLQTGVWYCVVAVFDPAAAVPVVIYTGKLNMPGDFVVDDDNYIAPGSGDPQAQQIFGAASFTVGKFAQVAAQAGFDGAIDTPIFWNRALTEPESRDLAAAYGEPSFYPIP